jgi:CRISPR-associated protein Cmr6
MSSVNLPADNRYMPNDTRTLLSRKINKSEYKDYNFFYLFNLPNISKVREKLRIRLNEEIENFSWEKEWLDNIKRRIEYFIDHLKGNGFSINEFNFTLSWRMIIGLGASHPQETSMTIHHIYGIPYIPGSAIKGVTRHWVLKEYFSNDEEKALKDKDFPTIFGTPGQAGKIIFFDTPGQAGKIIFFDAYPVEKINLKVEVMTPHYPDYYSEKAPPADWQSPNPIKFLTVEKTKFQFFVACKKEDETLLKKASDWLKEALSRFGIGAKTSVGYGYFDIR